MSEKFLVIGYGNSLRGDDGAGLKVAEIVDQWNLENIRSLAVHQLTPELSEVISHADTVIFIDVLQTSADQPKKLQVRQLEATPQTTYLGHYSHPSEILTFTQAIYGRVPTAYWILIPAVDLSFGEKFSSLTNQSVNLALERIKEILFSKVS